MLTFRSPAAHPFAGRTFRLSGALTPAVPGGEVRLQRRTGGEFQTIATQPLSATGGFDFGLREKAVGAYAYRVEPADPADPATDPTDPADPPTDPGRPAGRPRLPPARSTSPTRTVVVTGTTLGPGGVLSAGGDLWSPNRRYHLVMRASGNLLVLKHRSRTVWTTRTGGRWGASDHDADRRQPGGQPRQPAAVGDRDPPASGGGPPGPRRRQPGGQPSGQDVERVRPTPAPTFGERTI